MSTILLGQIFYKDMVAVRTIQTWQFLCSVTGSQVPKSVHSLNLSEASADLARSFPKVIRFGMSQKWVIFAVFAGTEVWTRSRWVDVPRDRSTCAVDLNQLAVSSMMVLASTQTNNMFDDAFSFLNEAKYTVITQHPRHIPSFFPTSHQVWQH